MSRVAYREPLSRVGFRPVYPTDPFQASHRGGLSGLGDAPVPDQSIVNYSGQWTSDFSSSPQDVLNQVSGALAGDGLVVVNSNITASLANQAEAALALSGTVFGVALTIRVNNGQGYAKPADVASIVNHEVYQATGQMPVSSTAALTAMPGTPGADAATRPNAPGSFTAWLEQNAAMLLLGLAGVFVLPALVKKL